jgi:protein involved in polysaccharide export with SLBB domain
MKGMKQYHQVSTIRAEKLLIFIILSYLTWAMAGCDNMHATSGEQLQAFETAGLVSTKPGGKEQAEGAIKFHAYKLATGDVLELQMPMVLKDVINLQNLNLTEPYMCRVNEAGNVCLPIIGEINVINKTLTEVESDITNSYYPKYFKTPPAVVCKVKEHLGERSFTVTGLVKKTGVFPYPTNVKYSLVDALAFSEGVDLVADPHYVKIFRRNIEGKLVTATFRIDNKSFSHASNIIIRPGDVVSVQDTPRTRINRFLADILRINFGAYVSPQDLE